MGALPKNKITSAERGKRRSGNKPSLKKDIKMTAVPKAKKGFVDNLLKFAGFSK